MWLVGAGNIAADYVSALRELAVDFVVVGRGNESAKKLEAKTSLPVLRGGFSRIASSIQPTDAVIVAVSIEQLQTVALQAMQLGVRKILLEKPGGMNIEEIQRVALKASATGTQIALAYNRRFFGSALAAQELISQDGGVTSFTFEFTEWAHEIETLKKPAEVKKNWVLANSSHVIDLAFHLGGAPVELCSWRSGGLPWHPSASIFSGGGRTVEGALFSYHANWESAGRWGLEMSTRKRRLIFRPMEVLQEVLRGAVTQSALPAADDLDTRFKPGLLRLLRAFLRGNEADKLCSIEEHAGMLRLYAQIGGYAT